VPEGSLKAMALGESFFLLRVRRLAFFIAGGKTAHDQTQYTKN
jgi:hypothetical protein